MMGSFFGVILYRYCQEDWSWWQGRSKCDHCGQQLAWFDNIPLLSFLLLKGRCRACKKKIDPAYFFIELGTGIFLPFAFLILYRLLPTASWFEYAFWMVTSLMMWLIFLFDVFFMIIPDKLVIVFYFFATGFLLWQAQQNWQNYQLFPTLIVFLVVELVFFSLWWGTKKKGFGDGDVKLIGPLILLMGYPESIVGVFLAFILGAVYGILLMIFKNKTMKQAVPFGPFLLLGTWLALLWGQEIWLAYWRLII